MTRAEQYYSVLGVDANVTPEQLKQAYRDFVRIWHPDRFAHDRRLQLKAESKLKACDDVEKGATNKLA